MKAPPATGGSAFGIAGDDPRARCLKLGDLAADVVALADADERAHPRVLVARVADLGFREPLARAPAATASRYSAGAMARRIAVHFCPALTVISVATSLTNRSNSGVPGAASGPSSEALRLSCSATKRTDSRMTTGWVRSLSAVDGRAGEADHVLAGQMVEQVADAADDQLDRARRQHVRFDHDPERGFGTDRRSADAGFTIAGTPASRVGASFSSIPQTGKLKALMCTAAPCSGV